MLRTFVLLISLLVFGEGVRAQVSTAIQKKGMWIWQLWTANSGNLDTVITKLKSVGVSWVIIKLADSDSYYNATGKSLYSWASGYGGMDSVVSIFHRNGIKILGYQYVYGIPHYGNGPSESDVAKAILSVKGIDGLVIDAEIQYDTLSTRVATAESYMDSIRAHYPTSTICLSSWSFVSYHTAFPWGAFLNSVDVNMPQTYWAARPRTPASELSKMSGDFATYTPTWISAGYSQAAKPIEPTGQAEYFGYSSDVAQGDIANFCSLSQMTYGYQGVSLWEYTQITHPYVWDEYAAAWPVTSVSDATGATMSYALSQNYPNPFNPSTSINYELEKSSLVLLEVFDVLGRHVATLVNERQSAGKHSALFNAFDLPSGVYFYRLRAGTYSETKKLLLVK